MSGTVIGLSGLALGWSTLWLHRRRLYRRLASQQTALRTRAAAIRLQPPSPLPAFSAHLDVLPAALPATLFADLRDQALALADSERSYLPGHKQGGTIAYDNLHRLAPGCVVLYLAPDLHRLGAALTGLALQPTPLYDQSSCSLLIYDRPRDHIGWHYDHNFYRGRHFTILLSLVNEATDGGLSSACLQIRREHRIITIPTPPNTLVLFEGARVHHRVTRLQPGQRRIVLSMTLCSDPRAPLHKAVARRFKDMAYVGPRALWT